MHRLTLQSANLFGAESDGLEQARTSGFEASKTVIDESGHAPKRLGEGPSSQSANGKPDLA